MNPAIVRIILRYSASFLVTYGALTEDTAREILGDPDVVQMFTIALGAVFGALSEFWYWAAKKAGGKT